VIIVLLLFNRVVHLGDVRGIVSTDRHRVVQVDFAIRFDDWVPIDLYPPEDRHMRVADRIVGTVMDSGDHRGGG